MSKNDLENSGSLKEIRFAVVMYGGVSLAIYINGIAQELLKMSRSTVKGLERESLKSTETVYRKISYLLSDREKLESLSKNLTNAHKSEDENSKNKKIKEAEEGIETFFSKLNGNPQTKFVVDVLTGTSAGGINAIFLAKALSNNLDVGQLKDLWLNEGDIGVLINDKKSVADNDLSAPEKAKSLLNSNRMYLKLLEAFDDMSKTAKNSGVSEYVDELDLFVPTTDFRGTIIPLRLLDAVVEEKRHRQVFHFRYDENEKEGGEIKNDFRDIHNPMLAFAARATSSFPFAFEPMRYGQAVSVIEESFADWRERTKNLKSDIEKFFPKIVQKNGELIEWEKRDMVDGGVLDNKPFSYAIEVLSKRRADFQVERKLLYIEPSPESFGGGKLKDENPPDVLENAVASLSSIPGYETIREDLEKLLERNRLIERVNTIIKNAEIDVFQQLISSDDAAIYSESDKPQNTGANFWKKKGLEDIVRLKGRAVLPYYRLRIAALTDDLARLVTKINGVDENSEYFEAIRKLVKLWREDKFGDYKNKKGKKTVMEFLWNFDLVYRLRRLRFVQTKASRLYFYEKDLYDEMCQRFFKLAEIRTKKQNEPETAGESAFVEENIKISVKDWKDFASTIKWEELESAEDYQIKETGETKGRIIERKPSEILFLLNFQNNDAYKAQVRSAISFFQDRLAEIFDDLQKKSKELSGSKNILEKSNKIDLKKDDLDKLLSFTDVDLHRVDSKDIKSNPVWNKFSGQINEAAMALEKSFWDIFADARKNLKTLFETEPGDLTNKESFNPLLFKAVRGYLKHYYNNFDEYDQISFPIFYQTQVGEAVKVDVMRISPKDATGLIDETESGKQKLAGESLFHFGAFLDRVWRWNDIMWGRLDGAERLITALLPDEKYTEMRKYLSRQAHVIILEEEFLSSNKKTLQGVLAESLTKVSAGLKIREVIGKVTQAIDDDAVKTKLEDVIRTSLDKENVYGFVREYYEVDKKLEPKSLLQAISRSTKVTGDIFEGIADNKADAGSQMRWIARLGQIFWGLVEVAAPGSFWNKLAKQWLFLLYLFEVVLIVGSTIFVKPEVQQFGIMSLILTLIIHLTAITLYDYMKGGKFLYLLRFVAVGLMAILAISGTAFIYGFFIDAEFWGKLISWQTKLTGYNGWERLLPVSIVLFLFAATLVWRETKKTNIRFFGIITLIYLLAVFLIGDWMMRLSETGMGIGNLKPTILLEFPQNFADIYYIARAFTDQNVVESLKQALLIDSFLFVPLYVAFLLCFVQLLRLRRSQWIITKSGWFKNGKNKKVKETDKSKSSEIDTESWKYKTKKKFLNFSFLNLTIILVSLLILIMGLADLTENYFSYAALAKGSLSEGKVDAIRYAATLKWFLSGLITAILSVIFWRKGWWKIFTPAFLIAAGICFAALFNHALFEKFFMAQFIILIAVGLLFIILPKKFTRD